MLTVLMPSLSEHCARLASPNHLTFALSVFIVSGILVSYLPQHYRIISRRSSAGLSPYFILLGTLSCTGALASILALPTTRKDIECCSDISHFGCFAAILGIVQVGIQWVCFSIILILWIIFFPRASGLAPPKEPSSIPSYRSAVIITAICILHAIITFSLNALFIAHFPDRLQHWANFQGVSATILAGIQYFPQIWTTWQLKSVGSLSIPMMCIQTPGSFVFAASLMMRLGWPGWSTWGLFLFTGCLQGCLLVMSIVFEVRNRSNMLKELGDGGEEVDSYYDDGGANGPERSDEQTPLLGDQDNRH